jgi:NAD(P)-dependent dehydrogenase (short-subunit alcohol dehydrogenase family)
MAVRNIKAGENAARQIEASPAGLHKKTDLQVWHLDLSKHDSVKAFVVRIEKELDRVDAVIQNAAVAVEKWVKGEEGLDVTMTVNFLNTMLLTILLIPYLRAVGKRLGVVTRIAIIGSGAAFMDQSQRCLEKVDKECILRHIGFRDRWESAPMDL